MNRASPLTEIDTLVLAYLVKYKVGTSTSIAKYYGKNEQVIRNSISRLKRRNLVDCRKYSFLETILDEETMKKIEEIVGPSFSKRYVICYSIISKEDAENTYFKPYGFSIEDILKWKDIRPVNYDALRRLSEELKNFKK